MIAIKAVEFPDKIFASKEELFVELKKHEDKLIGIKKSVIYKSAEKGAAITGVSDFSKADNASKAVFEKNDTIYPIISTTNYMDSHGDVHFNGSMNKTAKEQQGKVYYITDHDLSFKSIVAYPKDVTMKVSDIDWSVVGKPYLGKTQALIFEIQKDKIARPEVLNAIENKAADFQNSIRMVYHKVKLAVNSNGKDYAENKRVWDSHIEQIANKEVAQEAGYFWAVEELGIHKEGSLVIAGGSNDATSIYQNEKNTQENQPGVTTGEDEPNISAEKRKVLLQFI